MITGKSVIPMLFFLIAELGCGTCCEAATSLGRNNRITLTNIGDATADVGIHSIRMTVVIAGNIAHVRLNLLIANHTDEPRAGYLRMPLPDGSVVSEFAIDIKGGMLDAMPLNRQLAEHIWYKEASSKFFSASAKSSSGSGSRTRQDRGEAAIRRADNSISRAYRKAGDNISKAHKRASDDDSETIWSYNLETVIKRGGDNIRRAERKLLSEFRIDVVRRAFRGTLSWRTASRSLRAGRGGKLTWAEIEEATGMTREEAKRSGLFDPGLLSWDGDNRLRMQIYPIKPEKSRCVTIGYTTELVMDGGYARLKIPLCFAGWVRSYDLIIVMDKTEGKPKAFLKGLPTPEFTEERNHLIGNLTAEHVMLPDSLAISFAKDDWEEQSVQKASDGKVYFSLRSFKQNARKNTPVAGKPISTAAILWDASASEHLKSREKFLNALTAWLETPGMKGREIALDVVPFHIREEKEVRFTVSSNNTGELFSYLKSCLYDGATSLELDFKKKPHDIYLLFTNARTISKQSLPYRFPAPVFVFSQGPGANSLLMKQISRSSGGCYFDLSRTEPADAALCMSGDTRVYNKALVSEGKVEELFSYPWYHPKTRNLMIGHLSSANARGELLYGDNNALRIPFSLAQEDATEGEELRLLWAGRAALADSKNAGRIGKKHNIITPETSMLVMEEMEQYRVHGLPFPKRLLTLTRAQMSKTPDISAKSRNTKSIAKPGNFEVILPEKVKREELFRAYTEQRKHGKRSASFYLVWARAMIRYKRWNDALRILSNLRELDLIDNSSYPEVLAFQRWVSKYKRGSFWYKEEELLKLLLQPPWYRASAN